MKRRLLAALVLGLAALVRPAHADTEIGLPYVNVTLTLQDPTATISLNLPDQDGDDFAFGPAQTGIWTGATYPTNMADPAQTPTSGALPADGYDYVVKRAGQPDIVGKIRILLSTAAPDGKRYFAAPITWQVAEEPPGTPITTVTVLKHDGTPLKGVQIYYNKGGWRNAGKTGDDGTIKNLPLTANTLVQADLAGTSAQQSVGTGGVVFRTTEFKVSAETAGGDVLNGVGVYYKVSGWNWIGTTVSGKITPPLELFATKPIAWQGQYRGSISNLETAANSADASLPGQSVDVTFKTKKLTINTRKHDGTTLNGVGVYYNLGGWQWVGTTASGCIDIELFGADDLSVPLQVEYRGTKANPSVPLGSGSATVYTSALQTEVRDNLNGGISGAGVYYNASGWQWVGTTGGDGTIIAEVYPQTMDVQAQLRGSNCTLSATVGGDVLSVETPAAKTFPVKFYTTKVTVKALGSDNGAVSGVGVYFKTSGWNWVGSTGADGTVVAHLFPNNPVSTDWQAQYAGANVTQTISALNGVGDGKTLGAATEVVFRLTRLTLWSKCDVYHRVAGGGWNWFAKPTKYLFAGDYEFHFNPGGSNPVIIKTLTVPAATTEWTVSYLRLLSSTGAGLAGGRARGGAGSSYGTWHVGPSNTTNSDGVVIDVRSGKLLSASYEMGYNNGTLVKGPQNPTTSVYLFQTMLLTLRLEKADGTPIEGGAVRYGPGANYGQSFWPGSATNAAGETTAQWLPGTYSFEMGLNSTTNVKLNEAISPSNNKLTWKTSALTLLYKGEIAYGGSGDSRFFNKPTMEMMRGGTYNFNFRASGGGAYIPITIGDSAQSYCVALEKVVNAAGAVVVPDSAPQYYQGGWKNATKSNSSDVYAALIPSATQLGTMTFRAVRGGGANEKSQNIALDPVVVFKTTAVTVAFDDHGDEADGTAQYYAGGWRGCPINAPFELLPGYYTFAVNYKGMRQEKGQNIPAAGGTVNFATAPTTVSLDDHGDAAVGTAQFYASGWKDCTIDQPVELLPGYYTFAVNYKGMRQEKGQSIPVAGGIVQFETAATTVSLNTNGDASGAVGTAQFYASGWKDCTIDQPVELLPGYYTFAVNYKGMRQEKGQSVPVEGGVVQFSTVATTVALNDSGDPADGTAQFYASGWKDCTIDQPVQLLPGYYTFAVNYKGMRQEKGQSIPVAGGVVQFTTVSVGWNGTGSHNCSQFYASGWKDFSYGMQLLPGYYTFKYPTTQVGVSIAAGSTIN